MMITVDQQVELEAFLKRQLGECFGLRFDFFGAVDGWNVAIIQGGGIEPVTMWESKGHATIDAALDHVMKRRQAILREMGC